MKKIIYFFFVFVIMQLPALSKICYNCQEVIPTKGNVFEKVTGVDFVERKGAEAIIEKYLRFTLKSKVHFYLDAESAKSLRNGEFKSFTAKAKKIQIDGISVSDFEAKSICPYNRFLMKKDYIGFPYDIPVSFSATLTNEDMNYMFQKIEEQNKDNLRIPFGKLTVARVSGITWKTENSRARIIFKIITPIIDSKVTYTTSFSLVNGQLFLGSEKSNLNIKMQKNVNRFLKQFNPFTQAVEIAKDAQAQLEITDIILNGDKIYVKGVFLIPRNCVIKK